MFLGVGVAPGSQGGSAGSNPVGATTEAHVDDVGLFSVGGR
jgi:hypothetical protein